MLKNTEKTFYITFLNDVKLHMSNNVNTRNSDRDRSRKPYMSLGNSQNARISGYHVYRKDGGKHNVRRPRVLGTLKKMENLQVLNESTEIAVATY